MQPHLILDFSARTLCALVVTPDGQVVILSQEIRQVSTRAFPFELLLDPRATEDPEFPWDEVLDSIATSTPRTFFARARRLGLTRAGERAADADAVRLESPLALLSTPAARVDPMAGPLLPGVALLLLEAMLDPVFASLAESGLQGPPLAAVAIVSGTVGRHARLALHRIFRRRGFAQLRIVSREMAAAMARVAEPESDFLVWDSTGHDLLLHRVRMEEIAGGRRFHTAASRSAKGMGWPYWVLQAGLALGAGGHIPSPLGSWSNALDRSLFSLWSGSSEASELPTRPPLRLTQPLLQEAFDRERTASLARELQERVGDPLSALDAWGLPAILLGPACCHEPFQGTVLSLLGQPRLPAETRTPVLERLARGVATALLWQHAAPGRVLRLTSSRTVRLMVQGGEACELLPRDRLPEPGEVCELQLTLPLATRRVRGEVVLAALLWGSDPQAQGNAMLCALAMAVAEGGGESIRLRLRLRRSFTGRRLIGVVELGQGGTRLERPLARTSFVTDPETSCALDAGARRTS